MVGVGIGRSFDGRVTYHQCMCYNDLYCRNKFLMSYIEWMNHCSMISLMINKYVLLKLVYPYFLYDLFGIYI